MNKILPVLLLMFSAGLAHGQSTADRAYMSTADVESAFLHDHHLRVNSSEYNPGSFLLNLYKKAISEQLSTGCVYEISCSDFMRLSILQYGLIKGFFIGIDRLTRCTHISLEDIPEYKYNRETGLLKDDPGDYAF